MALIHHIEHPLVEGIRVGKQGPGGSYRINTSCIIYRLGDTIIDTGPSKEWKLIQRFLQERDIKQALLTHYHEDHSGNCGHIQDCFNAVVKAHHNGHERLSSGFDVNLISRFLFGNISFSQLGHKAKDIESAMSLDNGLELHSHHLPGHTNDSICLHEPNQGWLFSGDLYVSSKVRYGHGEENVSEQLRSLQAAIELDFDTLFCAHQGIINNGKQALQKKYNFLQSLQQQVRELNQQGHDSKYISKQLLGREDTVAISSGYKMSKHKLIQACLKN